MNLFWHLVKLSLKQQLAYRMALRAGLATNLFFGLLRAVLLIALYGQRSDVNGLTVTFAEFVPDARLPVLPPPQKDGWWQLAILMESSSQRPV